MTKRFANALTKDGQAAARSKFVIPDLGGASHFVEIATGRAHQQAVVVFVGRELETADVLDKLPVPPADVNLARAIVARFLNELRNCPLGSVISLRTGGANLAIDIDASRPKGEPRRRLPG
jgi:hypothetical protein